MKKNLFTLISISILSVVNSPLVKAQTTAPKFLNPTQELQPNSPNTNPAIAPSQSPWASWWNGNSATANCFGLGDYLKADGLTVNGDWQGNYYGNTTGGYRTGSAFDEQIKLGLTYDFNTLFGLQGLKAYSNFRYRDGDDINNITGAANGFNPGFPRYTLLANDMEIR